MTILFVALGPGVVPTYILPPRFIAHTKTSNGQIHDCCLQAAEPILFSFGTTALNKCCARRAQHFETILPALDFRS